MRAHETTANGPDRVITLLVLGLTLVGLVLVYSSSSLMNYSEAWQAAGRAFLQDPGTQRFGNGHFCRVLVDTILADLDRTPGAPPA